MSGTSANAHGPDSAPHWARAALLIAGITAVARIIGFLRVVVLAHTVGTTCLGDVYTTANSVPNIVYEVVVGGALAAVVVPVVARARDDNDSDVRATIAALHGWALVLLVPVTAVMYLASSWIIDLLLGTSPDCAGDPTGVATQMLWVFLLQVPIYGATVIAQGSLQAHHRFFSPALAPAVSSLVVIASYWVYDAMAGADGGSLESLTTTQFWVLAGGTTLGVAALLMVQIPALVRARLIVMPTLRFPGDQARSVRTLAIGGATVVASQWVAYAAAIRWSNVYGGNGSAVIFMLAWTVFLLPWAVLAFPIATATFPRLSVLYARGDREETAAAIAVSLRTVIAASAVGAACLAAAAEPLAVLMVNGVPGTDAAPALARIFVALAPGVIGYGAHGHLVRVLAAGHHAPSAAAGTAAGWLTGLVVAWVGVRNANGMTEVAEAIGVGFSIGLVVAASILAVVVRLLDGPRALDRVPLMTVAVSTAALIVGWLGHVASSGAIESGSVASAIARVVLVGVAALVVVGGTALLVDPTSARAFLRLRSRRVLDKS